MRPIHRELLVTVIDFRSISWSILVSCAWYWYGSIELITARRMVVFSASSDYLGQSYSKLLVKLISFWSIYRFWRPNSKIDDLSHDQLVKTRRMRPRTPLSSQPISLSIRSNELESVASAPQPCCSGGCRPRTTQARADDVLQRAESLISAIGLTWRGTVAYYGHHLLHRRELTIYCNVPNPWLEP